MEYIWFRFFSPPKTKYFWSFHDLCQIPAVHEQHWIRFWGYYGVSWWIASPFSETWKKEKKIDSVNTNHTKTFQSVPTTDSLTLKVALEYMSPGERLLHSPGSDLTGVWRRCPVGNMSASSCGGAVLLETCLPHLVWSTWALRWARAHNMEIIPNCRIEMAVKRVVCLACVLIGWSRFVSQNSASYWLFVNAGTMCTLVEERCISAPFERVLLFYSKVFIMKSCKSVGRFDRCFNVGEFTTIMRCP